MHYLPIPLPEYVNPKSGLPADHAELASPHRDTRLLCCESDPCLERA